MTRRLLMCVGLGALLLTHSAAAAAADRVAASGSAVLSPFPKGVASSGWLPFEVFHGSRIFIPAEINGVPTQVMLDSGASQTVIDAKFAKALRSKQAGHFTGQGSGGAAPYAVLHGINLKLGAITFRDTDAVGIDLSAVAKQVGHDLPTILGGEAFTRCVVDIDFARRRIAFRDPTAFAPPDDATALPVTKAGENFAIQANVEGRPASLVFDIGNASPLLLYPKFWNSPGVLGNRPVSTTKNGGLGGLHVSKLAEIATMDIAGKVFTDIPTILEAEQRGAMADGNVGLPVLRRFRLLVDLPHDRVLFAPPVDTKTPFDANHAGVTLAPDPAGERALYVAPGSPAEIAGLKAGDVITTIDGLKIDDWQARAGLQSWVYGGPGRHVRVGLLGGAVLPLTFGKYF